jgi:diguanylate cyclase (GGDEF)-like protein
VQIVVAFGLVGSLSYRNGQHTVEHLANQMMAQATNRIRDHLNCSLQLQQQAVTINYDALQQGLLNINDLEQVRSHLWQQINLSPTLTSTNFGNEQGEYIGYFRLLSKEVLDKANQISGENLQQGAVVLVESKLPDINKRKYYLVDNQGKGRKLAYSLPVDVRSTDWYIATKKAGKRAWSPIFVYKVPNTLGINAIAPIYNDQNELQGVFNSGIILAGIGTFLNNLNFSPSGKTFIIERSGNLVATSTLETPYLKNAQGGLIRLPATQSEDPQTRAISDILRSQYGDYQIPDNLHFQVPFQGKMLFVQAAPYQDRRDLDWLVVVVIPDTDFMGEIQANFRLTILISVVTLLIATGMGIMTTRWITYPILSLSKATQGIAKGDWQNSVMLENQTHQILESPIIAEVSTLSDSFHSMAIQLKVSFETLEHRVEERTDELMIANRKLESLVNLDGLTQIANRRCFNNYLEVEWQRHQREQNPLALILIDIDYFKRYNESYGHQDGDDCLIQVAQAIAQVPKRPTDLTARYGGEEFVIVLCNTDTEGGLKIAAEVQTAIANLAIPHETYINNYVTLSMGVASLIPPLEQSLETLIKYADQALYAAKDQGRNRAIASSCN